MKYWLKRHAHSITVYVLIAAALFFQVRGLIYSTDIFMYTPTAFVFLGAAALIMLNKATDELL